MNSSVPQSTESNLFEFHFTAPLIQTQPHEEPPVSLFQQQQPSFHALSYFAETTPNSALQENNGYSSPQLRPQHMVGFQRKRFKTVASSNYKDQQSSPSCNTNDEENDDSEIEDDDDESGNETGSNDGSVESGKKRGKYKIYSEEEKAKILNFMMKHGIQKTLEIFSSNTHKITKRKLKSWMESQHKVKGVKGRKTNDPNRDHSLYEWCLTFQRDCGRAPTRKEATKKALELSADSSFQASKGWLDKFSKKFNYEFTPLKIIPPKKKKGEGFMDSDSGSTNSNSNSSDYEGMSPVFMQNSMQPSQSAGKANMKAKPWGFENQIISNEIPNEELGGLKVSNFFNFNPKNTGMEMLNNYEKKDSVPSLEQNGYQQTLNNGLGNNMPFGLGNGMSNTMNSGMNNNMGYGFGYPLNYPSNHQMNFQINHQPNHQQTHQLNHHLHVEDNYPGSFALNNNHFYPDINGYLNTGGNYDNQNHHHHHQSHNISLNHNHNHHGHNSQHYTNNSDMKLEHPY